MQTQEEILCINRADVTTLITLPKTGLIKNPTQALKDLFESGKAFFTERPPAEADPSKKQLIPYCVFRVGNKILRYTRGKSGGEARLHAKQSIGIGGHINPVDSTNGKIDFETYLEAVRREIREEIKIEVQNVPPPVALINDDTNDVGAVHLGVVHILDLSPGEAKSAEDAIESLEEVTLETLTAEKERLETWSLLILENGILDNNPQ